jgi:hypothetical protein
VTTDISVRVEHGDVLRTSCDVLVLKHAQALYGVDAAVVSALEAEGLSVKPVLPKPGRFRLIPAQDAHALAAKSVLFLGVPHLSQFDYAEIREFGSRALAALSGAPATKRIVLTVHGPNYGLDESESFRAELAGLLDSLERGDYPESLQSIAIVERSPGRAERLKGVLDSALPSGAFAGVRPGRSGAASLADTRRSLADVGEGSRHRIRVLCRRRSDDGQSKRLSRGRLRVGLQRSNHSLGERGGGTAIRRTQSAMSCV